MSLASQEAEKLFFATAFQYGDSQNALVSPAPTLTCTRLLSAFGIIEIIPVLESEFEGSARA